jgi:hypothetical protein
MSAHASPRATLPPEMVTPLLRTVQRAREQGDLPRARTLLRRLAEQAPDDWQVWQALAEVAETDAERVEALERLASLAVPGGPRVTHKLDVADDSEPRTKNQEPRTKNQEPRTQHSALSTQHSALRTQNSELRTQNSELGTQHSAAGIYSGSDGADAERWDAPRAAPVAPPPGWFRGHWLTYASLGLLVLLLVAAALVLRDRLPAQRAAQATATPALATAAPQGEAVLPLATAPLPTLEPAAPAPSAVPSVAPAEPTGAPVLPTAPAEPGAQATSTPAAGTGLAIGQIVDRGDWSFTVLRPEHLLPLNGSIGTLAPQGRFVLALVGVSNGGLGPELLPADALALVDARGNRYAPQPAASSAYLGAFERGLRGDLSMEEPIPAGAGLVSVPVIFDVPPEASGLTLVVGDAAAGWPVGR